MANAIEIHSHGGAGPGVAAVTLAGLILAAGRSSRLGFPKPLLMLGEETFADRLIRLFAAHCDAVTVVLGHEAERVRAGLCAWPEVQFVVNAEYDRGQFSSMQTGLAVLPPTTDGLLFCPVDYAGVREETVAAVTAAARGGAALALPVYAGRRGHPVACAAALIEEFRALPETSMAKTIVHRHAAEACLVEVEDPAIHLDVDDAAAYARLQALEQLP